MVVKSLVPHWRFWGLCPCASACHSRMVRAIAPWLPSVPVVPGQARLQQLLSGDTGVGQVTAAGGCMAQIATGDTGGKILLAPNFSRREQLLVLIT